MSRWNGSDTDAADPKFRTLALTKRGWIAAVIATQANPVCGHVICHGRDHCALVKP